MANRALRPVQLSRIVDWIASDLRCICGNQRVLSQIVADFESFNSCQMQTGDGILISGLVASSRPRILWKQDDSFWVIQVPWDSEAKLSTWLAVSRFLRGLDVDPDVQEALDEEIERAETKAGMKRS